jgi:hypothetical protein
LSRHWWALLLLRLWILVLLLKWKPLNSLDREENLSVGIAGYVSVYVLLLCKHAECDHLKKTTNQKSSEAESLNIWRILHTWRWSCRLKHVVKDSGNQQ